APKPGDIVEPIELQPSVGDGPARPDELQAPVRVALWNTELPGVLVVRRFLKEVPHIRTKRPSRSRERGARSDISPCEQSSLRVPAPPRCIVVPVALEVPWRYAPGREVVEAMIDHPVQVDIDRRAGRDGRRELLPQPGAIGHV